MTALLPTTMIRDDPEFMISLYGKNQSRLGCVVWEAKVCNYNTMSGSLLTSLSADRRPIDPPPIVQLRVIDPAAQQARSSTATPSRRRRDSSSASAPGSPTPSSSSTTRPHSDEAIDAASYAQSFLQNPYYFMFASLARPDDDNELHWLKVNCFIHCHLNCFETVLTRTVARGVPRAQWYRRSTT